jgi:hypothetical protein
VGVVSRSRRCYVQWGKKWAILKHIVNIIGSIWRAHNQQHNGCLKLGRGWGIKMHNHWTWHGLWMPIPFKNILDFMVSSTISNWGKIPWIVHTPLKCRYPGILSVVIYTLILLPPTLLHFLHFIRKEEPTSTRCLLCQVHTLPSQLLQLEGVTKILPANINQMRSFILHMTHTC